MRLLIAFLVLPVAFAMVHISFDMNEANNLHVWSSQPPEMNEVNTFIVKPRSEANEANLPLIYAEENKMERRLEENLEEKNRKTKASWPAGTIVPLSVNNVQMNMGAPSNVQEIAQNGQNVHGGMKHTINEINVLVGKVEEHARMEKSISEKEEVMKAMHEKVPPSFVKHEVHERRGIPVCTPEGNCLVEQNVQRIETVLRPVRLRVLEKNVTRAVWAEENGYAVTISAVGPISTKIIERYDKNVVPNASYIVGDVVVLEYDPIIAVYLKADAGEVATVSYRVLTNVPPESETKIAELAACDLTLDHFENVKGNVVEVRFAILDGERKVYVPNARVEFDDLRVIPQYNQASGEYLAVVSLSPGMHTVRIIADVEGCSTLRAEKYVYIVSSWEALLAPILVFVFVLVFFVTLRLK